MRQQRSCPICNAGATQATQFISENIDQSRLTAFSFASRKAPEYMCHHMVRCDNCDLVYADAPPLAVELAEAYHTASYDSTEEANDAARAYALAIAPTLKKIPHSEAALEIGTGTGVFLEYLKTAGFSTLVGVEPSTSAIEAAPKSRRAWIIEGVFDESKFKPNSFDLICCFMTMEHVHDPKLLAEAALRLLRQGGAFVTVTHDYRSFVNRLMGKRSPIIDIEHVQIFSRNSIKELFLRTGFEKISVESFINKYSLNYWLKLSPIPTAAKKILGLLFTSTIFRGWRIGLNVGNTIAAGFKPADHKIS